MPCAPPAVERAAHRTGLTPRGAFHPEPGDDVPDLKPSLPSGTGVLVGPPGPDTWPAFPHRRSTPQDPPHGPENLNDGLDIHPYIRLKAELAMPTPP